VPHLEWQLGNLEPFVDIKTTKILHINFMNLVKMKSAKILQKSKIKNQRFGNGMILGCLNFVELLEF
jgi:hypothetical protein